MKKVTSIKYILWDIDGTLLDFDFAKEEAIRICFHNFKMGDCNNQMMEKYKEINKKYWQRLEKGEISKKEVLEGRFCEFFSNYGLDVSIVSEFNKEYQICLGSIVRYNNIYAEETVQALKGKYLQFATTNGTAIAQRMKLEKSGLKQIFDDIFISEEIGFEKPSIRYFENVFKKIGSNNREEYLVIGDSLTSDIQGGNNAEIMTCWFNPKGKKNDKSVKVDYEIHNLKELVDILLN